MVDVSASDSSKQGILLVNLGTPDSPDVDAVRAYLDEFLMDPLVVDIPRVLRWILVKGLILPRRASASAKLYEKIWSANGSPLRHHLSDLVEKCQKQLGPAFQVEGAMRYGKPSIAAALTEFSRSRVGRVWVIPLYPQYSSAATQSSIESVKSEARRLGCTFRLEFSEPFYHRAEYLECWATQVEKHWSKSKYDHLLFSFHGLPERQIKKIDATQKHCLAVGGCCDEISEVNKNCYRAQSYATARGIAQKLGLKTSEYTVCFQSRLGRTPWIRPYTDELYGSLPARGMKRIAVACPSFVSDCLETVEEVGMRGKAQFLDAGGKELKHIPSLNAERFWVNALCQWIEGDLKRPQSPRAKTARSSHQPST